MRKSLIVLLSALLFIACEKQSELVTIMKIDNVEWQTRPVESGAKLHLIIYAESQSSTVQHIELTRSDAKESKVVLDSALAHPLKQMTMSWYYTLPYYTDTTLVTLKVRSYDGAGNTMAYALQMRVAPGAEQLKNLDNMTIYSAASNGKSAFSMESLSPVYLGPKDSATVAFYDVLAAGDSLSCTWHSESGLLFSRAEGFDYAASTVQSLESIWPNLVHSSTIKKLKADDVLLMGSREKVFGAAKILYIVEEAGTENDRYIVSMKVNLNYLQPDPEPEEEEEEEE